MNERNEQKYLRQQSATHRWQWTRTLSWPGRWLHICYISCRGYRFSRVWTDSITRVTCHERGHVTRVCNEAKIWRSNMFLTSMLARCFIDYYFQWHRHGTCCVLHPEQRGTRGTIFICTKIIQCLFYPCFLGRGPIISCIFYLYIFKFLCLSPHNVWQPCLEQTCVFVQKSNKHAGNNIYTHFLRPDMFHCFGTHSPSFFKYTQE